jgi:hypothetical protein
MKFLPYAIYLLVLASLSLAQTSTPTHLLILTNGDRLTGSLTNEMFQITTSLGTLDVPVSNISSLEFGEPNADTIILLNGDRVTGEILDTVLSFKISVGISVAAQQSQVMRVAAYAPPATSEYFPAVSATSVITDHAEQTPGVVESNSQSSGVEGFQIIDNKWIFQSGFGRGPIFGTDPLTPNTPSIYKIRTDGRPLRFSVHPHTSGDSRIEFWADDAMIYSATISEQTWLDQTVDVPVGAMEVELRHYPTGWHFEYLYWSYLGPAE